MEPNGIRRDFPKVVLFPGMRITEDTRCLFAFFFANERGFVTTPSLATCHEPPLKTHVVLLSRMQSTGNSGNIKSDLSIFLN